jgi:hypothetical protein
MKEKIYTIPVTEAFSEDCECPVCRLEKKLEDEYVAYFLGPSLMEPDCRLATNEKGFCRRHFEQLYNRQENRLGLGLVIDTHLQELTGKLGRLQGAGKTAGGSGASAIKSLASKLSSRPADSAKFIDEALALLAGLENSCAICSKLEYTMERYMDVIMYLWAREADFRQLFNSKKGFCLVHFRLLLESAKKYLKQSEAAVFADNLLKMQVSNLERIQQEVHWFTKKFDYRNSDAPWGNSKDALPRSIQKLAGFCDLK